MASENPKWLPNINWAWPRMLYMQILTQNGLDISISGQLDNKLLCAQANTESSKQKYLCWKSLAHLLQVSKLPAPTSSPRWSVAWSTYTGSSPYAPPSDASRSWSYDQESVSTETKWFKIGLTKIIQPNGHGFLIIGINIHIYKENL